MVRMTTRDKAVDRGKTILIVYNYNLTLILVAVQVQDFFLETGS